MHHARSTASGSGEPAPRTGKVWLVGAGPGDPELLTLKGKRLLESADSVFYDELANAELLDFAPVHAERLYVGKRAHTHSVPQREIVAWMVERVRQGRQVVRLKGGDPFVFGRGGEEVRQLMSAGVAWEVVPGISSGFAVPAAAGIPVTDREAASSVHFYTGHAAGSDAGSATAGFSPQGTLVVFMGVERLAAVVADALRSGRAADTPVAVIERGTHPDQRVTVGTLADIVARTEAAGMRTPALIVIGDVVRLRTEFRPELKLAEAGPQAPLPGIILMAHGSSLHTWHESVDRLVSELAVAGQFSQAAYLEPARPTFAEVVEQAVAAGVEEIAVVPYFLAQGTHVVNDIPELIQAARARYPHLRIEISFCLEGHPALRTAVLSRAGEALAKLRSSSDEAVAV